MQTILWTSDLARLWPIMADAAIKGAVVLAGAGFATGLLRAAPAALRHLIWAIALLLTLAMPGLSAMMPAWSVLPGWTAPAVMAPLPSTAIAPQEIHLVVPALQDSKSMPARDAGAIESPPMPKLPTPPAPWSWRDWAALAWIIGAVLMLLPMTIAIVGLWWLRRRTRPIEDSDWNDLLKKCARRLALRWPVTLLLNGGRAMPMTWGTIRPRVLLPRDARQWNADRREVVLLHELAHIKRWDCLTQLIAQLARAVYWFNPLAWLAAARTLVERESACDDLVLRLGAKPSDYAEELLAVATEFRAPRLCAAAGVAMARSPRLEGRVRAILDQTRNRKRLTILGSLLATSLLVGGVLPIAALRSAAKADDQPATTTNDNATIPPKSDPWRATLANGIGVELVGVCDSPSAGKKWWRPDGSTLNTPPYHQISASVSPQSGEIAREIAVRLTNIPKDGVVDSTWNIIRSGSSAVKGGLSSDADVNLRWIAVSLPDDQSTAIVRFGIAADAWRTVAEQTDLKSAYAMGTKDAGIVFGPASEQNGNVVATVATDAAIHLRLVAIGPNGAEHASGFSETLNMGGVWLTTTTFNKLSLKDIKAIRLQTRPYEWIEFKNVALHPAVVQSPSTAAPPGQGMHVGDQATRKRLAGNQSTLTMPKSDPWRATLTNGIGVELVGVCESPSEGKKWWKPDGLPLDATPYPRYLGWREPQNPRYMLREIAVRLTNVPKDSVIGDSCDLVNTSGGVLGWWETPGKGMNLQVMLPADQSTATVRIGIAAGKWLTEADEGSVELQAESMGARDGGVLFGTVMVQNGEAVATVTTDVMGMDLRVKAIGRDGAEHGLRDLGTTGLGGHIWQTRVGFGKLSLKDIRGMRLESRLYEWVEFKNVALHPAMTR